MTRDDHILLLRVAYGRWRDCLYAHSRLAQQIAAGEKPSQDHAARVRQDLDRTLADFVAVGAQVEAAVGKEPMEFVQSSIISNPPAGGENWQMKSNPVYLPEPGL